MGGVQQGDPLGPLLFSLVILELLDDIGHIPNMSLNLWYLDDGTFVGPRESVASFLELVLSKGPAHGLYINMSKCEIFWPSHGDQSFSQFPVEVQRVVKMDGGAKLLGSPLFGTDVYFNRCFAKNVDKVLSCQQHLSDIEDPQVELHLLRSCLSICKVNHLLHSVLPDRAKDRLYIFDHGLRHSLETIINSSLSDTSWKLSTLPIRLGGLGLREASRTAAAAFVGSCNSTRGLACQLLGNVASDNSIPEIQDSTISTAIQDLILPGELSAKEQLSSLLPDNHELDLMTATQHQIQGVLDSSLQNDIKKSASLRDLARMNSSSAAHVGSWLVAIPNFNLGLVMSPSEFMVAVRIRLGLPFFPFPPASARCTCGQVLTTSSVSTTDLYL